MLSFAKGFALDREGSHIRSTQIEIHRIAELDGIRGIAVLWVVLLHFHAPFAASRPLGLLSTVMAGGWAGVDIFFVLSGYLITTILIATRDAENYFSAFYARRAVRIFPLYIVALAGFFWVLLPLEHRYGLATGFSKLEQVWYWLFLGNWRQGLGYNDGAGVGHFWSLAIEEQFYLAFSFVVLWVSGKGLVRVCAGMIALSIVLRIALAATGHLPEMATRLTLLHLDPIAMGALLAASSRARDLASRWWLVLLAFGLAGVFVPLPAGLSITAAGLGAAGAVGRGCTVPVSLFRWGVLQSLGKYSYAIYVIHGFLAGEVAHLAKSHFGFWVMAASLVGGTILSYVLAWLSWHLFEKWFLRLKRYFPYRSAHPEEPNVDHHLIVV